MSDSKNIAGIILSAGLSSRIGSPKALLEYDGINFITNIVLKLSKVCNNLIVVTGHESERVEQSFLENIKFMSNSINSITRLTESDYSTLTESVQFVKNDNYEKGMFTSLQSGIAALSNHEHIIYHFVDQPTLPLSFYTKFTNQINDNIEWLQPVYNEKKGHPIIFSKNIAAKILNSDVDKSLRDINKLIENKKYWECDYPEILDDIDTKSEYNNIIMKK
ncbi:MAG: NTP transferase domain-containing protein [Ignavibacteriae bacterium]|nr:hypothetical protein [Ignavibacteriota bacterium]NOG96476.1 NTP transferase domain-containing protein [Ignavibacteriota bacterium]